MSAWPLAMLERDNILSIVFSTFNELKKTSPVIPKQLQSSSEGGSVGSLSSGTRSSRASWFSVTFEPCAALFRKGVMSSKAMPSRGKTVSVLRRLIWSRDALENLCPSGFCFGVASIKACTPTVSSALRSAMANGRPLRSPMANGWSLRSADSARLKASLAPCGSITNLGGGKHPRTGLTRLLTSRVSFGSEILRRQGLATTSSLWLCTHCWSPGDLIGPSPSSLETSGGGLTSKDISIIMKMVPAEGTDQPLPAILHSCFSGALMRAIGKCALSSALLLSKTGKPDNKNNDGQEHATTITIMDNNTLEIRKHTLGGQQLERVHDPLRLITPNYAVAEQRWHGGRTPFVAVPILADVVKPVLCLLVVRVDLLTPLALQMQLVLLFQAVLLRLLKADLCFFVGCVSRTLISSFTLFNY